MTLRKRVSHVLPGFTAGITGCVVGHPFDTVKVRMQTFEGKQSFSRVLIDTFRREKMRGFFKGLTSPLIVQGIQNSILFGIYSFLEPYRNRYIMKQRKKKNRFVGELMEAGAVFLCGSIAGFGLLQPVVPFELVKIRFVVSLIFSYTYSLQVNTTKHGEKRPVGERGILDCTRHVVKTRGWYGRQSLLHGYGITFVREFFFNGIYFLVYETTKRFSVTKDESTFSKVLKVMLCGGLSGAIPWALTYPVDYYKSRVQADFNLNVRKIWRTEKFNVREIYKGLTPCMYRSVMNHAVTFLTWEVMMKLCGVRDFAQ